MRLVIQRVLKASVLIDKEIISKIGHGLFVLIGVHSDDTVEQATNLAQKVAKMRLMSDTEGLLADRQGKMNLTVSDVNGEMLVVSQFTLYGDTSGGNRPSFIKAARPEVARPVYEHFIKVLEEQGISVKTGRFGKYMTIDTQLDGPVTITIESEAGVTKE